MELENSPSKFLSCPDKRLFLVENGENKLLHIFSSRGRKTTKATCIILVQLQKQVFGLVNGQQMGTRVSATTEGTWGY